MALLFWILDSVIPVLIYRRVRGNRGQTAKRLILSAISNLAISIGAYSYYIGYSLQTYLAIVRGITPNGIYFSAMSALSAVFITICLLAKDKSASGHGIRPTVPKSDQAVLLAAVLVSLAARLIGFWWGGGMTFHPDEGNMVRDPMKMAEANTLLSDAVFYPAQISHKILSVCFKIYELVCRVFDMEYSTLWCYYIGRIYIALFSVGIVVCIFLIGNHLRKHAGTVACCMAAVFPPFVQTAHCITGDTVTALLGCLAMLAGLAYLRGTRRYLWLFVMSFLAAAAALEKWNGIVICGMIAVVVIVNYCAECGMHLGRLRIWDIIKEGMFAIGCVLLLLVLISPNLLRMIRTMMDSIDYIVGGYEGNNTFWDNLREYTLEFLSHAGILCFPLFAVGVWAMWSHRQKTLSVLSIGLLSMIGMCMQNRAFIRWGYSFYICFILVIGYGVVEVWQNRYVCRNTIGRYVLIAILTLIGANQTAGTVLLDVIYTNSEQDTRIASERWCQQQGIRTEDCIYDYYTCWAPGGISRYRVEEDKLGVERWLDYGEEPIHVISLGRKYAVVNKTQYPQGEKYAGGGTVKACFISGCPEEGFLYDFYHTYSPKIYELYSIYHSVKTSIDILGKKIWIGNDIEIYDISSFPAIETFMMEDLEQDLTEEGEAVFAGTVTSISEGRYQIAVSEPSFSAGMFVLEDSQGSVLMEIPLVDGQAVMELPAQHYYARCKIVVNEQDTFQALAISSLH